MDLQKGKEALKLSLEKRGITTVPSADLAFVLDVSGSFDHIHRSGITQTLLERLVPWGMLFDPDQKLDVFTFSSGRSAAAYRGEIMPQTVSRFIQDKIVDSAFYGGGTEYAPVLKAVLQNFGWTYVPAQTPPKPGFFGRMFGKETIKVPPPAAKRRSIVLFVTDGDNSDKDDAMQILKDSESRGDEVYFLFIGIGHGFHFLQEVADKFSNTGLVVIDDILSFVAKTDDEINDTLIGEELITWLKK